MPKLYQNARSKNIYAAVMAWDEKAQVMVRKRVSCGTDDMERAQAFADALESTAKAARALAGKTITREHAEAIFTNLLTMAGVTIEGVTMKPLPPLREFVTGFVESRSGKIDDSSYRTYKTSLNKFTEWLETLNLRSEPDLGWMTPERAEEYYAWMRERLAPKTAKERMNFLSRAFTHAMRKTDLAKNPVKGIEMDTKGETLDRMPFTLAEARKILKWLLSQGKREREWARLAMLALMSGCRIEDAIRMDQAMISKGVLRYQQAKGGKWITVPLVEKEWLAIIMETKAGPVAPELSAELARLGNTGLSSEFTGFVAKAGVKQEFKDFKSGARVARKTFHSLRHTLRTAIVSSGGSDAQADVILGHSEGEGKRYTHSEVEAMRRTLTAALR